jgi:two-component system sensor histidine kinase MprB
VSIRVRITLATTIALAVVAVLSAVAIYFSIGSELRAQTVETMRDIAARSTVPGGRFGRSGFLPRSPGRGGTLPGEFGGPQGYLQGVAPDGRTTRRRGDEDALPVDDEARRIAASGVGEHVRDDVRVDGTHLIVLTVGRGDAGALQVARPLTEVDRVLDQAATVLAIVTAIGVLVAVALGMLLGRVALRPIARFTREAEGIAADPGSRGRLDAVGRDEVSRLAASFNRTLDALERSLHVQQQLVADAGHELRTPIASIRANVQVLEDADRLPPEELAALRRDIVTELDELTELLGDVVELARASDPQAPVDDVRLDEVVRAAAERAARRGDSDVTVDLDLEPCVVVGDAARISRAVGNVIDNARKWSPAGGRIEVVLRDGSVRVRDHGPGFPPGELEHVFDRFWRAPDARSMPGSGLGLSIVRQAAQQHGGRAVASNAHDEGGGAVVEVSFGEWAAPDARPSSDSALT